MTSARAPRYLTDLPGEDLSTSELNEVAGWISIYEELASILHSVLARAGSDEESEVLRLRYGLDRGEPRTQGEVGEALQLTAERVRRIERDAIGKLRRHLVGGDAHDLLAS